jgi:putative cell wall-binding protein
MTQSARFGAGAARWAAIAGAAALLLALFPLATSADAAHPVGEIRRLSGPERLETAAAISRDAFPQGAETAIITRADLFPDALAGSHVAGARNAPILLTPSDRLAETTTAALNQLGAKDLILLGGTAAISTAVENQLRARPNARVQRVPGLNRYDTARLIAELVGGPIGTIPGPEGQPLRTAILAAGENFPDALASGPLSFGGRHPILLTSRNVLNNETRRALANPALDIQQVVIPGGFAAVSQEVENVVRGLGIHVVRLRGAERTDTARQVADLTIRVLGWTLNDHGAQPHRNQVNLATGRNFPDALALAPRAGVNESVILLTNGLNDLGNPTRDFINGNCADIRTIVIAGGTAAVGQPAAEEASRLARCIATSVTAMPMADTNALGETHTVTATALKARGGPAADATIRFEVYREAGSQPPAGTRFYREGEGAQTRFFLFVDEEIRVADDEGQAGLSYTNASAPPTEDRIVICAPPEQPADAPSCVAVDGTLPQVDYGRVVARKAWTQPAGG